MVFNRVINGDYLFGVKCIVSDGENALKLRQFCFISELFDLILLFQKEWKCCMRFKMLSIFRNFKFMNLV